MKLENNNHIIYLLLGLGFIAGVVLIFLTSNSYGGGDNFSHYKFAHWGWKYPELLFNHWGKPVFTILMSPFAQFGINGARVYNLLMGFSTALVVWKLALYFNFKNSALSLLLVLTTPIYFILMFTTLTEVSFSFFLALSVLLFLKKKYLLSAIAISFLPLVRTEGIVLLPLFILAYSLKKQFLSIPLLTTGFLMISILGFPYYDDFWWLITKMPYTGNAQDIYGSGSLFRFINDSRGILGYPIWILFVIGLFVSLLRWMKRDKFRFSDNFYFLLLIPGSYIVFFSAHSIAWWQGIGNSLGLIRVIASVTPFAALTALVGFNWLFGQLHTKNKLIIKIITVSLLIWIVLLGINTHKGGFNLSSAERLVSKVADYLKDNKLDNHKIFYYDSQLIVSLGLDPFDNSKSKKGVPDRLKPSTSIPDSCIIVWDVHFGPNEGRLPLNLLLNSNELSLLRIFKPTISFKIFGRDDYAIYVFQKKAVADPIIKSP